MRADGSFPSRSLLRGSGRGDLTIPRTYDHANHMVSASERELSEAGVTGRPEVVLADASYWSNDHIGALRARGMIPIVAPDTTHSRPRKTRPAGP